jgi:hypothetical protein
VLIAIVAAALIGRTEPRAEEPLGPDRAVAVAVASPAAADAAPVVTPVPTPSRRSDWPAAIGKLPSGDPGQPSTVHLDQANRFTIDDAVLTLSRPDRTPPWVRRTGGRPTVSADQSVR